MSTFGIGRRFLRLLSAAVVLAASCEHSNDVTGPSNPAPVFSLEGAWTGTFQSAEPAFYYSDTVSALASLQQTGANMEGTITISGAPTVTIHATVSNGPVSGSANVRGTIQDSSGAGTAIGTFQGVKLTITLHPHDASQAGTLVLQR